MIISNVMNEPRSSLSFGTFDFAIIKDRCELILRNTPLACDYRDDLISLQNGKYRIEDDILYIKAERAFWKYLPEYCERIDLWSSRQIYLPNKRFLENIENPPEVKTVIIKRWWRNNKKIQAIELSPEDPTWYKQKEISLFEMAISNFRLNESNFAVK